LTRGRQATLVGVNQHRHHQSRRSILILIVARHRMPTRNALRCCFRFRSVTAWPHRIRGLIVAQYTPASVNQKLLVNQ